MLGGVVVLGAIAIYMTKNGAVEPVSEEVASLLRMIFVAVLAGVAIVMFYFRRKRLALSEEDDPTTLNIIGWALGESVALFGAVILFLSGDPTYFLVGVVMMLVAFVFFPVPHR